MIGFRDSVWISVFGAVVLASANARAQTLTVPANDPLMQLMVTQPSVDVTSPVVPSVSFDPPVIQLGEKAIYRISLNALETSVVLPPDIQTARSLEIQAAAKGQTLLPAGNVYRPLTTFNFDVSAERAGLFDVPAFMIMAYGRPVVVPQAWLEVVPRLPDSRPHARKLLIEPARTNLFIGEQVRMRVLFPPGHSNVVEGLREFQITGDGFFVDKNSVRATVSPIDFRGDRVTATVYEALVTPIAPGQLTLAAQGFSSGANFGVPVAIHGHAVLVNAPQNLLVHSEPVTVNVRPLPREGELPGFMGEVGLLTCEPPELSTNRVRVGDTLQLGVVIRSEGVAGRVVAPAPPISKQWQIFPAELVGSMPAVPGVPGGVRFNYTLIPLTDDVRETPAIPFSCFDPLSEKYVDVSIPRIKVTVIAEGLPSDWKSLVEASGREVGADAPVLSDLAKQRGKSASTLVPLQLRRGFGLVQLLPALCFGGLWYWDRRRRFLERHPEILRRRRARRALRRERRAIQRAASRSDAPELARRAVAAMQIAAAPHYPAEPRALVGRDVTDLLNGTDQDDGTETVRVFFDAADSLRFGSARESLTGLLERRSALDEVLQKLEERLCGS